MHSVYPLAAKIKYVREMVSSREMCVCVCLCMCACVYIMCVCVSVVAICSSKY